MQPGEKKIYDFNFIRLEMYSLQNNKQTLYSFHFQNEEVKWWVGKKAQIQYKMFAYIVSLMYKWPENSVFSIIYLILLLKKYELALLSL